jgi:hypothetical protein
MIKKGNNKNMSLENNDYDTYWVPEDSYSLVGLASVGTVICTEAGEKSPVKVGMTYPMLVDGGWDIFGGVHLVDADLEWFKGLEPGSKDYEVVSEVVSELNNCRLSLHLHGQ